MTHFIVGSRLAWLVCPHLPLQETESWPDPILDLCLHHRWHWRRGGGLPQAGHWRDGGFPCTGHWRYSNFCWAETRRLRHNGGLPWGGLWRQGKALHLLEVDFGENRDSLSPTSLRQIEIYSDCRVAGFLKTVRKSPRRMDNSLSQTPVQVSQLSQVPLLDQELGRLCQIRNKRRGEGYRAYPDNGSGA